MEAEIQRVYKVILECALGDAVSTTAKCLFFNYGNNARLRNMYWSIDKTKVLKAVEA